MADPGGETGDTTLPFDPQPRDGRLRQRVERVTLEARATGRENHDDRFVRHVVHDRMLWPEG
jgi:hypothetical protein